MDDKATCANCVMCIRTYPGCECRLTDLPVEDTDEACNDFYPNSEDYEEFNFGSKSSSL